MAALRLIFCFNQLFCRGVKIVNTAYRLEFTKGTVLGTVVDTVVSQDTRGDKKFVDFVHFMINCFKHVK